MEDDAVALLDEGERPRFVRRRMTIAYRAADGKRHEFEMRNPHNDSMTPESFLPLKGVVMAPLAAPRNDEAMSGEC
jgi:hypothetical protein